MPRQNNKDLATPQTETPLSDTTNVPTIGRTGSDRRLDAFSSADGPKVFRSVCHRHEIWREDPFDFPTIHLEARDTFAGLLEQAKSADGAAAGRTLLILGESGAGKTHLMRVFRNHVHSRGLGYCGYLQMTSATEDYAQYVLSNLIDSLDQPYFESECEDTGLMRLSDSLIEIPSSVLRVEREALREDRMDEKQLAKFIAHLADQIIEDERYEECDVHLVQALLYLQRDEPRIKSRVLSYLRCEDLSDADRRVLGGIVPRKEPERTVEGLGRLMRALEGVSLVVCVDQLEDMAHFDRDAERFRRAVGTVCALAERVPSSLFVISCLEDLYPPLKQCLTRSFIDRLEHDPEPLNLKSGRSLDEIIGMVGKRLKFLYESSGAAFDKNDPTFPIPQRHLEQLANIRARDVLDWCRGFRNRAIAGEDVLSSENLLAPGNRAASVSGMPGEEIIQLTQSWNDFLAGHRQPPPDDEDLLGAILGFAVSHVSAEIETGHQFLATDEDGKCEVEVKCGNASQTLKIGLCNKSPLGGALSRQVDSIKNWAGGHLTILVRSTDFPDNPKTKIARQIAEILKAGGRRIVVEDSDWRAMQAMRFFLKEHQQKPGFAEWLKTERPLAQLKSLREILDLDSLASQSVTDTTRRAA